ncbi:MAG TPA: VapC toxin family PIN domain ribonuclease [Gammaproteobacteria bacterium]|nr:VapC toxin family PIN domain ribonuclease [Gammaproteobacteria bacterium]
MKQIYFDTSAWVKYFLNEEGTLRIQHFILQYPPSEDNRFATSAVTYAEMMATLTRAWHGQRISEEDFEAMVTTFEEQWKKVDVIEVNADLIEHSGQLARKYALRGCDAFQLASALNTQTTVFISCDHDLNNAAKNCGLDVWNPVDEER